jgi:hypothetical protein
VDSKNGKYSQAKKIITVTLKLENTKDNVNVSGVVSKTMQIVELNY